MESKVNVEDISIITPHNKALYEAGKTILVQSITVSRDFCKFMITLSTSAIPIHLGLLKFVVPEHYTLNLCQGIFASIPSFLFLISAIIFTFGYYPKTGIVSLDIPMQINREITKTLSDRKRINLIGFLVFSSAVILMILCVIYYLTTIS